MSFPFLLNKYFAKKLFAALAGLFCIGVFAVSAASAASVAGAQDGRNVITITQTPCQFIETERELLKNPPGSYEGCKKFNEQTKGSRPIIPMKLKPGKYIFRVTNKNVPYDLGFWFRGKGLKRAILPSVSGGSIPIGGTKDFAITLVKGKYLFSCPLNPTPDYPITVED